MTGIICGIKRMEIHDGDGIRTTVFFKGCPLRCLWCHNPESVSPHPEIALFDNKCIGCGECRAACPSGAAKGGRIEHELCTQCGSCANACPTGAITLFGERWDDEKLFECVMNDAPFFKNSGGGVTLSGGECLMQADFALALAKRFSTSGISVNIDTSGYADRRIIESILPYTDTFLYDIKAADPARHKALTGRDNGRIIDNLRYLSDVGAKIEVRVPLVTGLNDMEAHSIGELLAPLNVRGVKVLRYHDYARSRYTALGIKDTMPRTSTSESDVEEFVSVLRSFGIRAYPG